MTVKRRKGPVAPAATMSAAAMRAELAKLGPKAVDTLNAIMCDEHTQPRLKADISMYVIDAVLDDPQVLQQQGDTLTKLAEILRHPGHRPPIRTPTELDTDIV
jgi:hypothetical protein